MRTAQDIILKPVITEDSMDRLQANRYTFKVAKDANKIEIGHTPRKLPDQLSATFRFIAYHHRVH